MHERILEDICRDECDKKYCLVKEMMLHSGIDDRTAVQFKMVEIHKFNLSNSQNKDIGWTGAWNDWVMNHAKSFADVYDNQSEYFTKPRLKYRQLYDAVLAYKQ